MEDTALLLHLLGSFSLVAGSVLAGVVGGLVLVVVFGLWLVDLGS